VATLTWVPPQAESNGATHMAKYCLNLKAIEQSLREVQRQFPKINELLQSRRDHMTDEVVENMLAGYTFVDAAIGNEIDLFGLPCLHGLLELNHLVLCGPDLKYRQEHHKHIEATRERFYDQEGCNVDTILAWYQRHEHNSPWKRAAGVYVRILSQPQLYFEGNHRTGALIMSYLLVRNGQPPFVLSVDNAKAYFDPSTLIKLTKKTPGTRLAKLPRIKNRFANFLHDQANVHYLKTD
jgi:hypothetical protein